MPWSKIGMILSIVGAILGGAGTISSSYGDYSKNKQVDIKKED